MWDSFTPSRTPTFDRDTIVAELTVTDIVCHQCDYGLLAVTVTAVASTGPKSEMTVGGVKWTDRCRRSLPSPLGVVYMDRKIAGNFQQVNRRPRGHVCRRQASCRTDPPSLPSPYQSQERPPAKLGKTSGRVHAVAMTVSHRRDSACPGLPCTPAWTRPIVNHLSARQQVLFSPRPFLHQVVNRMNEWMKMRGF